MSSTVTDEIDEELTFSPARRLIRNRSPDGDGVFRIKSRPVTINVGWNGGKVGSNGVFRIEARRPLLIEVYGVRQIIAMIRKADGLEIG